MIERTENEKQKIIAKYEAELTGLSIDIAEKIIRNEIDTKDNVVAGIIRSVISDYRNVEWIKVYISDKDDVIAVQADKDLINDLKEISKDVKIEVLAKLEKGSAIVETEDGIVEASIDTQLNNLREMVLSKNAG
jgi:flagellar assembly protein FliH